MEQGERAQGEKHFRALCDVTGRLSQRAHEAWTRDAQGPDARGGLVEQELLELALVRAEQRLSSSPHQGAGRPRRGAGTPRTPRADGVEYWLRKAER